MTDLRMSFDLACAFGELLSAAKIYAKTTNAQEPELSTLASTAVSFTVQLAIETGCAPTEMRVLEAMLLKAISSEQPPAPKAPLVIPVAQPEHAPPGFRIEPQEPTRCAYPQRCDDAINRGADPCVQCERWYAELGEESLNGREEYEAALGRAGELATQKHAARAYSCNVPMCGESGVCVECRKRGLR